MRNSLYPNYKAPRKDNWTGRDDGSAAEQQRWHQVVELLELQETMDLQGSMVLLGFASDEGVRRNQGRVGAAAGPQVLRQVLAGLPVHFDAARRLVDLGDVCCEDQDLERAQATLADAVCAIRAGSGFPIILGGGHELTYAHFKGLQRAQRGSIGIINIDAHLDLREPVAGAANSGTGFYQIAEDCKLQGQAFHYLALGIQEISNTKALFQRAQTLGVSIVSAHELQCQRQETMQKIQAFTQAVDQVYLTVDMDAFAAAYAPGVSAVAFNGIIPDAAFMEVFTFISGLPNLIAVDFAEVNPIYDQDQRTAKLAAFLIFNLVSTKY